MNIAYQKKDYLNNGRAYLLRTLSSLSVICLCLFCLGCQSSAPEQASSDSTPTPAASETPDRVSTDGQAGGAGGSGTGGSAGSGSSSGGQSSGGDAGLSPEELRKAEQAKLSPTEWREKNYKPKPFKEFKHMKGYPEVVNLYPQPVSQTNIESGRTLYSTACVACHRMDGSAVANQAALVKYNMANLSLRHQYKYGSTPRSIYRSIAYGCPAPPMGGSIQLYSQQQIWDMVNFIQSLQKE